MSTQRSALLEISPSNLQPVSLPQSYPALVHLLSSLTHFPVSRISVVYSIGQDWLSLNEEGYDTISKLTGKGELKLAVKLREPAKWTINYVLSFIAKDTIEVRTIDTGGLAYIRSSGLHWSGRVCMSAIDRFFFSGGYESPRFACEFDLTKGEEHPLANMLRGRIWHGVCCLDETVYAVGGREKRAGQAGSTAEVLLAGLWVSLPMMVFERESMGLVAHGTAVYAFGGFDGEQRLDSIEKYEGTWILLQWKMPQARQMVGVCFIDQDLAIVAGGQDQQTEQTGVVRMNLKSGEIKALPSLPMGDYFTGWQLVLRNGNEVHALAHYYAVLNLASDQWVSLGR